MKHHTQLALAAIASTVIGFSSLAAAAVSSADAEKLKTTLTPFGAEKAGNKEGTIPAWTGGYTTPIPGFKNGGKRGDPFAAEKPLFSITSKNMAQYADKLSDGSKALLQKFPETYRLDVYPTHRTAAAPQWVYDNTFKNATQVQLVETPFGPRPKGPLGGMPFPIPKTGEEVIWNHLVSWRGEAFHLDFQSILVTAAGQKVPTTDGMMDMDNTYYNKTADAPRDDPYYTVRLINAGPPIRAGEAIVGRINSVGDDQAWVYLTGQRRVRKLPNPCCDTPSPSSAGVMSFDDIDVFAGRIDRFDWKIIGKKEIYIPYNDNKFLQPDKSDDVLLARHLNPDHVRWELHRVWVVEATLKAGQRHQAAKSVYYIDEDTWGAVLGDRWDANGQLWKSNWQMRMVMPDVPATGGVTFGFYDLLSGVYFVNNFITGKAEQMKVMPHLPPSIFTPEGLIGESTR